VASKLGNELVEERNHRDVIKNHCWSGRYLTKDLDKVSFAVHHGDD
jgi:hypothetical protein